MVIGSILSHCRIVESGVVDKAEEVTLEGARLLNNEEAKRHSLRCAEVALPHPPAHCAGPEID
ncbi:MAG: hypothetical protein O3A53_02110 [Acidobacteria bacterium]|nr:hypothetical protein [Acidobacteriota bacterium]MDA1233575.1 hypothetical protein [Acidobacteriota bacterium]